MQDQISSYLSWIYNFIYSLPVYCINKFKYENFSKVSLLTSNTLMRLHCKRTYSNIQHDDLLLTGLRSNVFVYRNAFDFEWYVPFQRGPLKNSYCLTSFVSERSNFSPSVVGRLALSTIADALPRLRLSAPTFISSLSKSLGAAEEDPSKTWSTNILATMWFTNSFDFYITYEQYEWTVKKVTP